MKKTLFVALLLCCGVAFAQSSKREEGIKFGVKGGINMSNFNGDLEDNAARYGLHIGLMSEIIVNDKVSIQPELMFSAQGYKNEIPGTFSKEKFDYVILPVLLKYYVADNVSIEAGPQVGFLVNAKSRNNDGNAEIEDQSTIDFAIDLGLGYELKNGFFFQGRYCYGITNVNGADNADAFKYTNSVFQLSVGYMF